MLAGTLLIVYSQWLFKKTYAYFAEGVAGLGAGVLFLSLYAAWNFYHLVPNLSAFGGMVAVTAVLLGLALARDSQRIAVLALVGGFVTPLLVSTGTNAQVALFSYLALLNAGLLWVAYAKNWRALPLAFIFSLVYFWGWYQTYYEPSQLTTTLGFAMLFFAEFAALPALRALKTGSQYTEDVVLALLNSAVVRARPAPHALRARALAPDDRRRRAIDRVSRARAFGAGAEKRTAARARPLRRLGAHPCDAGHSDPARRRMDHVGRAIEAPCSSGAVSRRTRGCCAWRAS